MAGNSKRFGVGLLIFAAGCGLGILGMAALGTSPEEAQTQREAPIIAPGSTEVVRQTIADQERASCSIDAPVSEIGVPNIDRDPLVVSKVGVEDGQAISGGDFLFEISGHPVVAFETSIPFYRDLTDGSTGEDVQALEENLVELGLLETADTNFDSQTSDALATIFGPLGIESTDFLLAHVQSVVEGSTVAGVNQTVGTTLTAEDVVLVLAEASPVANCSVPQALSIEDGEQVWLEVGNDTFAGSVGSVEQADDSGFQSIRFTPSEPFDDIDTSLEATLVIETATTGEGVLTVPVGALFESPSGGFEVRVDKGGEVVRVPIMLGVVAGGFAEVNSTDIEEGDIVQLHNESTPTSSEPSTSGS